MMVHTQAAQYRLTVITTQGDGLSKRADLFHDACHKWLILFAHQMVLGPGQGWS